MRTFLSVCAISALLCGPPSAGAQQRDTVGRETVSSERGLPREVAHELTELYNAPAVIRASGKVNIPSEQQVTGNVAVLFGPLTVAGNIAGDVIVINGDVSLQRGSRIDGDLVVVGGVIAGGENGTVGGNVRVYRQTLRYHEDGERIIADRDQGAEVADGWIRRLRRGSRSSTSKIALNTRGAYNRVEGLAIELGPSFRFNTAIGRVELDARGIIRSADNFSWVSENLGHDAGISLRTTGESGIRAGARVFDVVGASETWQTRDTEVGLASFFLHRDYRDYFDRHGATASISIFDVSGLELMLSYSGQRWGAREDRDPFTLFNGDDPWRPNPDMDVGRFRVATIGAIFDTRNDQYDPWSGWLIAADVEHGRSGSVTFGTTSDLARPNSLAPQSVRYTRGFLDLRRYNRVSPKGQLNFRLVMGGWLGGDELPLQRRFSLGGAGTLPGYRFRGGEDPRDPDVFTCGAGSDGLRVAGNPAQCERLALAQAEYRGDLHIGIGDSGDDDAEDRDWHFDFARSGSWVVFADAGRGWLVGQRSAGLRYPGGSMPPLNTFKTDLGLGLDFNFIGVYVAKSVSDSEEPARFFVRLRHRF